MAIDYYGLFPCKVRESVTDADLLRMEKAKNRAQYVLETMRNDPVFKNKNDKPESEWTFTAIVRGPEGDQETKMKIGDLLAEAAPLQALSTHCKNCPFNVRGADFGCGGAIHYPINPKTEYWLVSRLPADLKSGVGELLTRAIAEFEFDGSPIDNARNRKDLYVADRPAERHWGGGLFSKKTQISSSQILQMTFGVGSLEPTHAKLMAYFLGFLNDNMNLSDDVAPTTADDEGIVEMKYFYIVAALAGVNNIPVLIDA